MGEAIEVEPDENDVTTINTLTTSRTDADNDNDNNNNGDNEDNNNSNDNDNGYQSAQWQTQNRSIDSPLHEIPISEDKQNVLSTFSPAITTTNDNFKVNFSSSHQVTVASPEKHGEGFKDAYVTFEIILKANNQVEAKVRRRYQDFCWLYGKLAETEGNLGAIVPPLPDRHRLDYLDRFTPDFLRKRQLALERFLKRLLAHPTLSQSPYLCDFLTQPILGGGRSGEPEEVSGSNKGGGGSTTSLMESLGDTLVQAFGRRRPIEERFIVMKRLVETMEKNFDRLADAHGRLVGAIRGTLDARRDASQTLYTISSQFGALEKLFMEEADEGDSRANPDIDRGHSVRMRTLLGDWGQEGEEQAMGIWNPWADGLEMRLALFLSDAANYTRAVRATLRTRDQRQFEWQDIADSIESHQDELNHLTCVDSTRDPAIKVKNDVEVDTSASKMAMNRIKSGKVAVMNYLTEKVDQMRGIDPISARTDRIKRLETRLADFQEALRQSQKQSQEFDERVGREFALFLETINFEMSEEMKKGANEVWTKAQSQLQDRWDIFARDTLEIIS